MPGWGAGMLSSLLLMSCITMTRPVPAYIPPPPASTITVLGAGEGRACMPPPWRDVTGPEWRSYAPPLLLSPQWLAVSTTSLFGITSRGGWRAVSVERAIAAAVRDQGGDALVNATVDTTIKFYLVFIRVCTHVKGTVVRNIDAVMLK